MQYKTHIFSAFLQTFFRQKPIFVSRETNSLKFATNVSRETKAPDALANKMFHVKQKRELHLKFSF